ncbi:MAG: HAMP domain-containing protein [Proteobacteria bacterium]|nr:HAMP domain-containing protein [Pseudomonadota bacterium]
MQLRLWQRLFLAFAALSIVTIAGFVVWQQRNFRSEFIRYLDQRMTLGLQAASERLGEAYAEQGSWDFLRNDRTSFEMLVDPYPSRRGRASGRAADDAPPRNKKLPSELPLRPIDAVESPLDASTRVRVNRILLLDAQGAPVAGEWTLVDDDDVLRVAIRVGGKSVGSLITRKARTRSLGGSDLAFAVSQRSAAIGAGLVALLIALGFAFAIARWLIAPVRALTRGVHALTAGDYTQRVAPGGSIELAALAQDYNRLAQTLEAHREGRRRWGADIAHELRTPLSVLRGEIAALQDGVRAPTIEAFDSLAAESDRLSGLIEDLYQLALADAGALEYRFETLDVADLVRDAAQLHTRACADEGLVLETVLPGGVVPIHGDARRLGQLLDNLIVNARRYTDTPGRLVIALSRTRGVVQLTLDDTPPAVPEESLPMLFERLYRVDAARGRANGGAGLGLAICRAIVEAHGGTIRAAASTLGGLRILIEFPQGTETIA